MTRDRKWIVVLTAVAAMCATIVGTHLATATGPPVQTVDASVGLGPDNRLTIQFLGDTMLGDGAQATIDRKGYGWPFRPAVKAALDGDYVIANLEAPITHRTKPLNSAKEYNYSMSPTGVGALKRAGVDAVSLDNNHSMDAGRIGLADTLSYLRDAAIPSFGAGRNLRGAEKPLLLHSKVGTVGIVGLGEDFGSATRAEDAQPGTVVLSPQTVQRGIDLARAAGADWVIAFVHWGDNYMPINAEQRYWARMLVDAGYDMVVGAGPHVAQPISFIDGVPIVYSLGNFVFGAPGRFDSFGLRGYGLMLSATLSKTEGIQLAVRCVLTNNDVVHFRPTMCSTPLSMRLLQSLSPRVAMDGNLARVQTPHPAEKDVRGSS